MTSTITVIGVAADALGHSLARGYGLDERGAAHRHVDAAAVPAAAYFVSNTRIPVDWNHGRHLGQVVYLERRNSLTVVAELDVARLDGIDLFADPVYWSTETIEVRSRHGLDAELLAVALTPSTASVGLAPVHVLYGDVDTASYRTHGPLAGILTRAATARRRRRSGDPIHIADAPPPPSWPGRASSRPATEDRQAALAAPPERLTMGPVEWWPGTGTRILSVR